MYLRRNILTDPPLMMQKRVGKAKKEGQFLECPIPVAFVPKGTVLSNVFKATKNTFQRVTKSIPRFRNTRHRHVRGQDNQGDDSPGPSV